MKSLVLAFFLILFTPTGVLATPPASDAEQEKIRHIVKEVLKEYATSLNPQGGYSDAKPILHDILNSNRDFVKSHAPAYFQPFLDEQNPRATVVTCSDSSVQTQALDAKPDGDLFMVRDIGNQIATAEGSVEYGVHHLHTPLLLIVGHTACGAIKAAAGNYSQESGPVRRELDSIEIPKGDPGLSSVKLNVHNQVRVALAKFEDEVLGGHLTVVGAVYDFRNEMRQGQGRLNIINVNGETDPATIAKLDLIPAAHSDEHVVTPAVHVVTPAVHRHRAASRIKPPRVEAGAKSVKPAKKAKKRDFIKLPEKPAEMDKPEKIEPKKEAARDAKPGARTKARSDDD